MTSVETIQDVGAEVKRGPGRPRTRPPKEPAIRGRGRPPKYDDEETRVESLKTISRAARKAYVDRGHLGVLIHRHVRKDDLKQALLTAFEVILPDLNEDTLEKALQLLLH
jgi:hypothetical protein